MVKMHLDDQITRGKYLRIRVNVNCAGDISRGMGKTQRENARCVQPCPACYIDAFKLLYLLATYYAV